MSGNDWSGWRLDRLSLIYEAYPGRNYPVDLQNLFSSSRMLDVIFQVAGKSWATDTCLVGLIRALDELLYPQVHLCSGGRDKKLTIKQVRDLLERRALQ